MVAWLGQADESSGLVLGLFRMAPQYARAICTCFPRSERDKLIYATYAHTVGVFFSFFSFFLVFDPPSELVKIELHSFVGQTAVPFLGANCLIEWFDPQNRTAVLKKTIITLSTLENTCRVSS